MAEYRARFSSVRGSVGEARRAITQFAQQWFSGADLSDIESAAGEALANSAEHGARRGTTIDVCCRYDGQQLTIEIKDDGSGFPAWEAADIPTPPLTAMRGFGRYIMRRLMDEIEYTERGSCVRLIKRSAPRTSADPR